MPRIVLCLTGTIVPNTTHVARSDVQQRAGDYLRAIDFYLNHTPYPVVFAENSTYEIGADGRFENCLRHPAFTLLRTAAHPHTDKGKGFQEFYMLDKVVETLPHDVLIVKITGRYVVRNITAIAEKLSSGISIDLHRKMKVAITGLFAVSAGLYRSHFTGIYAEADDARGRFIEHVLYDTIHRQGLLLQCALLPENPQYEGISGSYGATLARNKYKMSVRGVERLVSRRLGIREFMVEY